MSEDRFDERFDELLRDEARESYNPPPEPPREEMWARIEEGLRRRRVRGGRAGAPSGRPRWLRWGVGLAAMLAVGIGVGRLSAPSGERPATVATPPGGEAGAQSSPGAARDARGARSATPYRLAATRVLSQAEALLTSFGAEGRVRGFDPQTAAWAREVLSTTRLLMDSPAAADPRLRGLLEDLELTLAQIVQLRRGADAGEREWIEETVQRRDVLTRLRAATMPRPAEAGT